MKGDGVLVRGFGIGFVVGLGFLWFVGVIECVKILYIGERRLFWRRYISRVDVYEYILRGRRILEGVFDWRFRRGFRRKRVF